MKSLKKIHDYLQSQYPEYRSSMDIADAIGDESRSVARKLLWSENVVLKNKGNKHLYRYKDELMRDYIPNNLLTERICFRLSTEVLDAVRNKADEQGITAAEWVRRLLQ